MFVRLFEEAKEKEVDTDGKQRMKASAVNTRTTWFATDVFLTSKHRRHNQSRFIFDFLDGFYRPPPRPSTARIPESETIQYA